MKASEEFFPVVVFITLYNQVLTFEGVHEILQLLSVIFLWYCVLCSTRWF